jgi:hypothetical protein
MVKEHLEDGGISCYCIGIENMMPYLVTLLEIDAV